MSTQPLDRDAVRAKQSTMVDRAIEQLRECVAGRVIVITGGARGIGRVMAEGMLRAGARVVAADKTWLAAEDFRAALEASGNGLALEMDVTSEPQLDAAYAATIERC